jgi:membrane fusion protein, multidrug efflux system
MKILSFLLLFCLASCQSDPLPYTMERVLPVITSTVTESETPIYLETIGNIYSPQTVQVKAQVQGKLQGVHVQEGQEVKKGDLLFNIEANPFQANLDRVEANLKKDEVALKFAKNKFKRHETLVEKDFVSRLNYDQYEADVDSFHAQTLIDKAEVAFARINLDHCTIRAPIDGRVSQYNITKGNLVGPNDAIPMIEIRQIAPIYVNFYLSQDEFQQFTHREAREAALTVLLPKQEGEGHRGTVFFVDNQFDLNTGSILLKGALLNEDRTLWPGEFVKVRILVHTIPDAKLIPAEALQIGQNGEFVYVVKPNMTVERRSVKTQGHFGEFAIIEKGLEKDELVVIEGQINLHEGAKIMIKQDKDHESV